MKKIEIVKSYGKKRIKVSTINEEPSLTQQAFKEDTDVNIVLERYMKTGEIQLSKKQGFYGDVSEIPDLTQATEIVAKAQQAFDSLDAKIRYEFKNDPRLLMQFLQDPKNKQRGIELGLFNKPEISAEGTAPQATHGE